MRGPATAVAAPHPAALGAADAARERGGNALDAALAAAVTLAVAYPHQCSLGGDLVALVREPDGAVTAIVSTGAAPMALDVGALRAAGPRMPAGGPDTATVPGVLAGWAAVAARGAALPLADHLAAAADLAAAGVPVVAGLARAIDERAEAIAADAGLSALLMPGGTPLRDGHALVQPRLAATMRTLAADGLPALYGGPVGAALCAGLRRLGARMTVEDLAAHEAEATEPLTGTALGARWWAAPPPTQGAALLALLAALDAGRPPLEAARAVSAARDALLGDPRIRPIDVAALLRAQGPAEGAAARAPHAGGRTRGDAAGADAPRRAGDTVAVATADADGRVVALIQSVFQSFGAGILEPETGIVVHNRGSAFSLEPGHPAEARPGARPPHTLCPALVALPDGTLVAAGCQGGRAQPQVLAQVAPALTDPDADLQAALERPRWVVGARDLGRARETVVAEAGAAAPDAEAARLDVPVERLAGRTDLAGHVQAARLDAGGDLAAASDPRADGERRVLA